MPLIAFWRLELAKKSIFVAGGHKFQFLKFGFFLAFFEAKMTKIDILNFKLIVTNDYQQFWTHFDWFLSLFQISDVKPELSYFKQKVRKNGIFWTKNLFKKNFLRLFLSPNPSYAKKSGQKGL